MAEKNGIADQFELIKNYARQETLDPLKGAGQLVVVRRAMDSHGETCARQGKGTDG